MEQIIQSRFFEYAIKDKAFTKSLNSYSSKFPEDIKQLNFYLDNSFLDPYSRVFLLIKMHEQFIQKHKKLLLKKDRHIKSVFYELIETNHFHLKYTIKGKKDLIVFLSISIPLWINNQLHSIVERTDLSKSLMATNQTPNNQCFLITNFDLLCLSPFILSAPKLKEVLINDISNINKEFPKHEFYESGTDPSIVMSTVEAIYDEISIRANTDVIRNYYLYEYLNYTEHNSQLGVDCINNLHFDTSYERMIPEYFKTVFLKTKKLSELKSFLSININGTISIKSKEKEKDSFLDSEVLKKSIHSKITIHSTFKLADKIFKKYFELNLPKNRYKTIYPNFTYFLKELFDNDIINKDLNKVKLNELEVKNFIGFFSEYKSTSENKNLFSYKVVNLVTFLEHITGLEATISTWEKAHRMEKYSLSKDYKRQINSILDTYPEDKKW